MVGGRQREFDRQDALNEAMHVFWKKGYAAASLADLTKAMGINKPSLYATFGNKEQLFVEATEHYIEHHAKPPIKYLYGSKTLKSRVKDYLMSIIKSQCDQHGAKGCYVSTCVSEAAGGDFPEKAAEIATKAGNFAETFLTQFFQEEMNQKHLSSTTDCTQLARFMVTLLHGTAAMARAGKPVSALESIVDMAILTLDSHTEGTCKSA